MLRYPVSDFTESEFHLAGNLIDSCQSNEPLEKPYVKIEIDVCLFLVLLLLLLSVSSFLF